MERNSGGCGVLYRITRRDATAMRLVLILSSIIDIASSSEKMAGFEQGIPHSDYEYVINCAPCQAIIERVLKKK